MTRLWSIVSLMRKYVPVHLIFMHPTCNPVHLVRVVRCRWSGHTDQANFACQCWKVYSFFWDFLPAPPLSQSCSSELLSCQMTIWKDHSAAISMLFVIQAVKTEDDDFQEFQDASKSGSLDDSFTDFQGDVAGSSKAASSQHRSR